MQKLSAIFFFSILLLLASCDSESGVSPRDTPTGDFNADELSSISAIPGGGGSGNGQNNESGLITAGEWNDLDNWNFWNDILIVEEFTELPEYWRFNTQNRISVLVFDNYSKPMADIDVILKKEESVIWRAKTDNLGKAELWIDLFENNTSVIISDYQLIVDNSLTLTDIKLFQDGINEAALPANPKAQNKAEIAFVVDATGSMGDEVEFLKSDLIDVITKVENSYPEYAVFTSSVFYRDEGDDYLTKLSPFSNDVSVTQNFIEVQSAGGGGDYPEAVHTALNVALDELQWSGSAKTRILFLLLDAPPHYEQHIVSDLHHSIKSAAEKGIKIIPVVASGVNKKTEFLMRFFATSTNGTYVFITNDSGIGNDHIEASVGEFEVEFLNDLMVRLLKKYME